MRTILTTPDNRPKNLRATELETGVIYQETRNPTEVCVLATNGAADPNEDPKLLIVYLSGMAVGNYFSPDDTERTAGILFTPFVGTAALSND